MSNIYIYKYIHSHASNVLPFLRPRSQGRQQIVGGLMINCALGPAKIPHLVRGGVAYGESNCNLLFVIPSVA